MHEPVLLAHIRRTVARGYRPTSTWSTPVEYLPARPDATATTRGGIGFVLPTQVSTEEPAVFGELVVQFEKAARGHPDHRLVLMIGMQWHEPSEQDGARRQLADLVVRAADRAGDAFDVVGLLLRGPIKVRTLNAAIRLAEDLGLAGIGWADDDVRLADDCLTNLVSAFLMAGHQGAVGATKIPHASRHRTSKVLHRAKAIAAPATNYPHGCCILVGIATVAGGIPDRYVSDDGYVCFQLLDPGHPDPLHSLKLVPDALVHYQVAGPAGATRRRIRRLLLNHHVYLADWPYPVARYYFREILFAGMWPLTGWDGSRGRRFAVKKAAIKWLYFLVFARVGAELYVRGLLGRPLTEIVWSGYREPISERRPRP